MRKNPQPLRSLMAHPGHDYRRKPCQLTRFSPILDQPVRNRAGFDTALYTRVPTLEIADGTQGKGACCFQRCYSVLFPDETSANFNFSAPSKCNVFDNRALGGADRKCTADEIMFTPILRTKRRNCAILQSRCRGGGEGAGLVASATSVTVFSKARQSHHLEDRDARWPQTWPQCC